MRVIGLVLIGLATIVATAQTASNEQKVIKDPAEYNTYIAALNMTAPAEKAAAMEAFVQQYPASIVMIDALSQAMAAYQQAGNAAKVVETATRILAAEPRNVRALAILTAIGRAQLTQADAAALARLSDLADRGLTELPQWQNHEGMSDADFAKLRDQMTTIFNGGAGFTALQKKDYAAARGFYLKSVAIDPNNLQDVYQLAIAELEMTPLDPNGFWYVAKAYNLAQGNAAAQKSIEPYGSAKYKRFHGSPDGWAQLLSSSASQSQPPPGFNVSPAPTPAELAVTAVRENDPKTLSIGDWEYVLSYRDASAANKDAAESVWRAIQAIGKNGQAKMKLPVKVISANETSIEGAITDENQVSNTVDLEVTLEKPLKNVPAPGSMVDVIGVLSDYRVSPFSFVMKEGELAAK